MYFSIKHGLSPADRIVQPIFQTGLSKHHSIYLGTDQHGMEWVAENDKFGGVVLTKVNDFFKEKKCFTIQRFCGNFHDRKAAVQRALSKVGAPYDLLNFNCEHYAEYVQTGNTGSKQVDWVKNLVLYTLLAIFIGGLVYNIANSKKSQ